MSDKRMELEAVYQEWKTTTREGRAFFESPYNLMVFYQDGVRKFTSVTVENLTFAYRILSRIYDFSRDAKPVKSIPPSQAPRAVGASEAKTPAVEPSEIPEHELPGFPVRGGLEDGWLYQQRLTAWREQRAQQAWKERENKRLAAQPPAQSTINRTKAEIKGRREANARHAARNPYQPE